MQVKEKFIRNNLLILTIGLDILFVIIFFIFYLSGLSVELELFSVFSIISEQPSLLIIIIHPLVLWVIIKLNTGISQEQLLDLKNSTITQESKFDQVYEYIEKLRIGESKYVFNTEFKDDKLVRSILNLSAELDKARKEEEFRAKEEQQRHWTNEGLAKFGAILRENVDDLEKLSSLVTSNLTRYVDSQQAGFFYINEEDGEKIIEMLALFAFDRKKFPDKKFKWGEGLIGACALEQKTIFLKKTSDSFVDITSGLGNANPRSILIVPIKDNADNIHGVLELASFKVFEDFEVNFVEQVAESIGLTMATIKTNIRTQELLRDSQKQAEMLAQQETNTRQNIEEIEKEKQTIENTSKKLISYTSSVDKFLLHAEISTDRKILYVNKKMLETLSYESKKNLVGQDFSMLIHQNEREWFNKIWKQIILNNESQKEELKLINSDNSYSWLDILFIPVTNKEGKTTHINFIATEQTKQQNKSLEQKQIQATLDQITSNFQLDYNGKIIAANENFINNTEFNLEELTEKNIFDLIPEKDKDKFSQIFKNIKQGNKYREVREFVSKSKKTLYLDASFLPILDFNNNITKINVFTTDLTDMFDNVKKITELTSKQAKDSKELEKIKKLSEEKFNKSKEKLEKEFSEKNQENILYKNIFSKQNKAVIVLKENEVVHFNTVAETFFELKKAVVIGKKSEYLFPIDEKKIKIDNYIANFIKTEQANKELCFFNRAGQKKEVITDISHFEIEKENYTSIIMQAIAE